MSYSMVLLAAFCIVVGASIVPFSKFIKRTIYPRRDAIEEDFKSAEYKIKSLQNTIKDQQVKNDFLEEDRNNMMLEASVHCEQLKLQMELELQKCFEEKLEQTLKRVSNYSSLILQSLRESSVDAAVLALHKLISCSNHESKERMDFSELQKDIRKKFH